ncbi:hypothetical protein GCM10010413_51540 [Promicromonospora sukumoe]
MQKDLASVLVGDETEAFVGVEPLDLAGGHCNLLLCLSVLLAKLLRAVRGAAADALSPDPLHKVTGQMPTASHALTVLRPRGAHEAPR